jgi:hypothetical protein
MDTPFVLVTTHRVDEPNRDRFHELSRALTEYVEANEPEMLAYYAFFDADGGEVSLMQVHRDAGSADRHLELAHSRFEPGLAISEVLRIEVYGAPGPLLREAIAHFEPLGVAVSIKPALVDGFTRAA